ncbi:MAG: Unknown protein [uncultured Sulfurovum sp.]|uniref:SPOR domain-containing protein n=1 Tax=uncultured Sulfurovum sp. TaxID=269237 RepID=A0A6S6RZV8_9BACT|nr:MAG: Unknown protein [uncultured Sulfurovum sp.]
MIRFLLLLTLLLQLTYANSEKYFIQFGSFKNLKGLEKSIDQLPSSLRSHVVIVRSNSWYIPFAYYTSNRHALTSKVASYKRYFKDAHIAHSSYMLNHPLVRNYATQTRVQVAPNRQYIPPVKQYQKITQQYTPPVTRQVVPQYQNVGISEEDNTLGYTQRSVSVTAPVIQQTVREPVLQQRVVAPVAQKFIPQKVVPQQVITQKVVRKQVESNDIFSTAQPKKYKNFSKQMLSGQHYYLAYKKTANNPNLLIKVSFENHKVTYQPVIGEMKMTKASYLTENNKLYMFADTFERNGSFSKLDEHRSDHFLVSSWADGKKLNTLRYYYKMNDAKKYLGLIASDGLAEILSEGDYDDFFLEE